MKVPPRGHLEMCDGVIVLTSGREQVCLWTYSMRVLDFLQEQFHNMSPDPMKRAPERPRRSPICLLLQQCLDGTDPGAPLLPAPATLLRLIQSPPSEPPPGPASTPGVFLPSLLIAEQARAPKLSELFHRGGGCRQPPGQPASAGPPTPPLSGPLFQPPRRGSGGWGPLLPRVGGEEARGRGAFLKVAKPARRPHSLPGRAETFPG